MLFYFVGQGATIRTACSVPDLHYTYIHALCCIILPLISLGFLPPPPSHPGMDILGPHSISHDHIYTYVALSCHSV